jgi:glycosyltransferase involved in cell wall biosynthesis
MENPKISVIIPVYNTEEYVKDTILSMINQTIKEIEIIVINDGSTDNSLHVIHELAGTDNRIQVFSQNNKGLSEARNAGMQKATGQYIYFMDSDDLLDHEALLSCYKKCEKEQLDFVFFDAEVFGDDKRVCSFVDYYNRAKYMEDRLYNGKEILNLLLDKGIYKASVCLNLIRHEFIKEIGLNFYPGIIHEDELFTGMLYIRAGRVGCISRSYFKRRVRTDSITRSKYSYQNINGYLIVVSQLIEHVKHEQTKDIHNVYKKLIRYILDPSIYNAGKLSLAERMNVFGICLHKSYFKFIKLKSILVLLFPFMVPLKGYFKNKKK